MVVDQLNLEKLGIPTVTIVTDPFLKLAGAVARAEKMPEPCLVAVPHPIGMIPPEEVEAKATAAFASIMKAATEWQPSAATQKGEQKNYPAQQSNFNGGIEEFNQYFFKQGWSLGLPILPPTPEKVKSLLSGTRLNPAEVVGEIPPMQNNLTVELVAVYAAMAGCKPEYMPVLIAAIKAFLDPGTNWRGALATTGTTQFVVIVDGPIVKEVGIAYGQGAAGKGYHANASIGYALNLITFAVGGSRPPDMDKSTLASPGDYVCWVFGENEDRLPQGWNPLHVDRGFKKTDNVVTVMTTYPPIENIDHGSINAEEHLRWWSHLVNPLHNMGGPTNPLILDQNPIIAIGPEHAKLLADGGWTKDDFRRAFWQGTKLPLGVWPPSYKHEEHLAKYLGPVTKDTMIPVTAKPEQLQIVIAGGDGKHSHYFGPFPASLPASRLIEL